VNIIRSLFWMTVAAVSLPSAAWAQSMSIKSAEVAEGAMIKEEQVFNGFGCTGSNESPSLSWSGAPSGTKSFAVTVYDPDAPTGSGWWHWIVYNMPADTAALPAGAGDPKKGLMPTGVMQGRNDYGNVGYGGPCPPPGKPHHYNFTLYALKVAKLEVPQGASAALIGFNARAQALGEAKLTGMYGR
jgi:Raf kinase inhibitor-like YbhB/YbcL family protein